MSSETRGVPATILEKIEKAEARRRRTGMHGEGDEDEDEERSMASEDAGEEGGGTELERADAEGVLCVSICTFVRNSKLREYVRRAEAVAAAGRQGLAQEAAGRTAGRS